MIQTYHKENLYKRKQNRLWITEKYSKTPLFHDLPEMFKLSRYKLIY